MTLPKVDPTKMEITNPRFRIVEKIDPVDGMKMFYPQRKWMGLFWIRVIVWQNENSKRIRCDGITEAIAAIERFKSGHVKENRKIHYL